MGPFGTGPAGSMRKILRIVTDATDPEAFHRLLLQSELFGSTFVLVQHLGRRMDALLAPMDLTTRQWLLLAVLSKAGRPLSLSEAAVAYGSSRQNVKAIALGLERRGFLRLAPDPADARALLLHPTPLVAQTFETPEAQAQGIDFLAGIFAGLSPTELADLHRLLRAWLHSLTEVPR
jgi:DNA-binding MarR family transcriptional regulator